MQNERLNLPSASGLERIAKCPGSWRMEQGLPEVTSELASEGSLIHAYLAGENVTLTDEQLELVERTVSEEVSVVLNTFGLQNNGSTKAEERLWYNVAGMPVFSGKFDKLYIDGDTAILFDYKFGFIPVTNVAENIQLRAYALLVAQNYGCSEIYVAVIQPRCKEQSVICKYDKASLVLAHNEVLSFIKQSYEPDAPLVPNEQACKYCRANSSCPAASQVPVRIAQIAPPEFVQDKIERLTDDELQSILDQVPLAETVIKALKAKAKQRLEESPDALPHYTLKYGSGSREISDSGAVIKGLRALGLSSDQILSTVDIGITALEKVVKEATGLKGRELKEKVTETFGDAITVKAKAPTLERVA